MDPGRRSKPRDLPVLRGRVRSFRFWSRSQPRVSPPLPPTSPLYLDGRIRKSRLLESRLSDRETTLLLLVSRAHEKQGRSRHCSLILRRRCRHSSFGAHPHGTRFDIVRSYDLERGGTRKQTRFVSFNFICLPKRFRACTKILSETPLPFPPLPPPKIVRACNTNECRFIVRHIASRAEMIIVSDV